MRTLRAGGHTNEPVRVRIHPGTYVLSRSFALTGEDGGSAAAPVVYEVLKPRRTQFRGGIALATPSVAADRTWQVPLPPGVGIPEQLYDNGRRAVRARAPDSGFFKIVSVEQTVLSNDLATIALQLPTNAPQAALVPGAVITVFHKWDTTRASVESADPAKRLVQIRSATMKPWNPIAPGCRCSIENAQSAWDAPGEWIADDQRVLHYRPLPGESPQRAELVVPTVERFLEIQGAEHLTFRGFRFLYAADRLPPQGNPPAQAASQIGAAVELDGARGVVFEDCELAHTGGYGLWARRGCSDIAVRRTVLQDLGAGGIRIGEGVRRENLPDQTGHVTVENSIIRSTGRIHPSAVGLWIGQSADNRILNNEIADTFYSGLSVGWTWGYGPHAATNNLIAGNYVHDIGQGMLCDMGGIYTLGVSPGTRIVGNRFEKIEAYEYGGWGLYTDEGSTGIEMTSNVVIQTRCVLHPERAGGFHQHYGCSNVLFRNVFFDASGPQIQASRVEEHLSFTLIENTIANAGAAIGGTWNPVGPWDKLQVNSVSNTFWTATTNGFAQMDFPGWQKRVGDRDSRLLDKPPRQPRQSSSRRGPSWL